jgi:hypothetical protein
VVQLTGAGQALDEVTFIIREPPFLFLLIGSEQALLVDSGTQDGVFLIEVVGPGTDQNEEDRPERTGRKFTMTTSRLSLAKKSQININVTRLKRGLGGGTQPSGSETV